MTRSRSPDTYNGATHKRVSNTVGSFIFSCVVGVLLFGVLIYFAGLWNILAHTRLLDPLINAGVIAYHDDQMGLVKGVSEHKFYLMSQDPIDWGLVLLAAVIILLATGVKASQFHSIARFFGIEGSFGQHARAHIYGVGISRLLPFRVGDVATAKVLAGQGAPLGRATSAVFVAELFVIFEIVVFALLDVFMLGWSTWLSQIFWALVTLGVIYLLVRSSRRRVSGPVGHVSFRAVRQASRALAQKPALLLVLCLLSLIAFLLFKIAVYLIAMAFTSDNVHLGVAFSLIVMGGVAGSIARLIPITPGGIGQFEAGFATALYLGDVALKDAVTIAILANFLRSVTELLLMGATVLWYRVETNLRDVLDTFAQAEPLITQEQGEGDHASEESRFS